MLYNKFYVDEFYTAIIVKPINKLSKFFRDKIEVVISGFVSGLSNLTASLGFAGREVQNGSVGLYLFSFVIGVVGILIYLFLVP